MQVIQLTRGYETVVDDEDYDDLIKYSWYASGLQGRPARRLKAGPRKLIYMYHHILSVLPWVISLNGYSVDHIDGDPLNNCRDNLRLVTQKDNMRNTIRYGLNQGIAYDSTHDKWKAYIDQPDQPRINVGTFVTEDEARKAVQTKRLELGLENN